MTAAAEGARTLDATARPRVAIIGTGQMGSRHVEAWQRLGAEVVVHSRSAERGRAFASEHGVRSVTEPSEVLAAADVIDICTPTDTHATLAHWAAGAGRHVVCEKPLAREPAEGRTMIDACIDAGVGLCVAQVLRYFPAYVAARDAVAAGRIGRPKEFTFFREAESPGAQTWFADVVRSGGLLVDLAIHDLDYARWVAGEVSEVVGRTTPRADAGSPQRSAATLTHVDGVTTRVEAVWDVPGTPVRSTFELAGDEGVLRFDSAPRQVVTDGTGAVVYADDGSVDPFAEQFAEFVTAFAGGVEPRVTAEDGLTALAIALAAEESARTGRPVDPASLRR
ncbi:Gfo/Idh/MocA family protein [Actinopolymorpha singaporensis]|uniref:Predicted dehydrogenase n=1 Tax=Actinopolymorpha singaporensis TaxID=117157 RepID=A0A1H1MWV6_9ACTN|nr:Gfo/Idh/MocA family oxidoreductase [Actinopolymorpha singaporensis]SDR91333.1 Predicted dehydrogenase [Actinopolymorpha singaporensis]